MAAKNLPTELTQQAFPPALLATVQALKLGRVAQLEEMVDYLRLADRLGQINRDVVLDDSGVPRLMGFAAWLRAPAADLWRFSCGGVAPLLELTDADLTGGPLLFVLDLLAERPGYAYHACRMMTRLPGVRFTAGWRTDGRLRVWSTRQCRESDNRKIS